jgi:predicted DNA-binding protein YlxM (UPF0122 family)
MDVTVFRTMLFDFYGELLTEKQREYFDLHYNKDLSLAEIASLTGISRQGVWDIIRRAEIILRETEEKTGLVRRSSEMQEIASALRADLEALRETTDGEARALADRALQRLGILEN